MMCSCRPRNLFSVGNLFSVVRPLLILTLLFGQIVGGRSCCCFSSEIICWLGDSLCYGNALQFKALACATDARPCDSSSAPDVARYDSGSSLPGRCPKCIGRQMVAEPKNAGTAKSVRGTPAIGTVKTCQCPSHKVSATVPPTESSLDLSVQAWVPRPWKLEVDVALESREHRASQTEIATCTSWQARACIWRI